MNGYAEAFRIGISRYNGVPSVADRPGIVHAGKGIVRDYLRGAGCEVTASVNGSEIVIYSGQPVPAGSVEAAMTRLKSRGYKAAVLEAKGLQRPQEMDEDDLEFARLFLEEDCTAMREHIQGIYAGIDKARKMLDATEEEIEEYRSARVTESLGEI